MAIPANGGSTEEPLGRAIVLQERIEGRSIPLTVPEEILAGGGPSSIGNPCPGQVHHRIETFQVRMILEGNSGCHENPERLIRVARA